MKGSVFQESRFDPEAMMGSQGRVLNKGLGKIAPFLLISLG